MLDLATVYAAMQASSAAYETDDAARAALLFSASLDDLAYVQGRDDSRALVAASRDGRAYLAFQGTQFTSGELASIIENVKVEPRDLGNGALVDAGYWQQLRDLLPSIAKLPPWTEHLIVTGHSMGGAIAHLMAGTQDLPEGSSVVTFGAPKCANSAFWRAARKVPQRYVHERDFAPDWPYLPAEWTQPTGAYAWLRSSGLQMKTHGRDGINVSIEDHLPDAYLVALKALVDSIA